LEAGFLVDEIPNTKGFEKPLVFICK